MYIYHPKTNLPSPVIPHFTLFYHSQPPFLMAFHFFFALATFIKTLGPEFDNFVSFYWIGQTLCLMCCTGFEWHCLSTRGFYYPVTPLWQVFKGLTNGSLRRDVADLRQNFRPGKKHVCQPLDFFHSQCVDLNPSLLADPKLQWLSQHNKTTKHSCVHFRWSWWDFSFSSLVQN